jgi:predicted site-specific integrase-resolvase
VYKLFNKGIDRKTYLYARVSTPKQKPDLENQVNMLKQFCFSNGWSVNKVFQDVASGISFEKRKDFFNLLDDVTNGKVERVVITYKDRLSRVGFELFYHLFKKYHTEIIIMSEIGSQKLDSEEIFEEIVSLLHCYSMKLYSKRKGQKIKQILDEKEELDNDSG